MFLLQKVIVIIAMILLRWIFLTLQFFNEADTILCHPYFGLCFWFYYIWHQDIILTNAVFPELHTIKG